MTFAWNPDDVAKVFRSFFEPGAGNYKYIELPLANYASSSYDKVMKGRKTVGLSMFSGYPFNERSMLSLGIVDPDIAIGENAHPRLGRGEWRLRRRRRSRRHEQLEIKVEVAPAPYARAGQANPITKAGAPLSRHDLQFEGKCGSLSSLLN